MSLRLVMYWSLQTPYPVLGIRKGIGVHFKFALLQYKITLPAAKMGPKWTLPSTTTERRDTINTYPQEQIHFQLQRSPFAAQTV